MHAIGPTSRVTSVSQSGDVDTNGDLVGELERQVDAATRGPLEGRYRERPGLDERIRHAGAEVGAVRRLLRVPA